MAKRRRVGNLLALAVLTALMERPMHPYEMASVLRERGKEQDMNIKWGSLYTVVANLEKHGLIEATGSTRQGGRPERTTYRLTGAGRDEAVDWIRELIAVPEREHPRFIAGLSVWGVLGPDEAITLLGQRLETLRAEIARQRTRYEQAAPVVPRLFLVEGEYDLAVRQAEADWVAALLDELTRGTFPGLAQWRAWHRSGEPPADWVARLEGGGQA
jgi:DNA-binding PadR family transcriptional regulator